MLPLEQFTDGAGYDWNRMRFLEWISPESRVAVLSPTRFVVAGPDGNGSGLVAELFEVVTLEGTPEITLLHTASMANTAAFSWESNTGDTVGMLAISGTQAIFVGLGTWHDGTMWRAYVANTILTMSGDTLSWGPVTQMFKDETTPEQDVAYGFSMCSRADPSDGVVVVYIRSTNMGLDLAAVRIAADGSFVRDMLGFKDSAGISRELAGSSSNIYVEGPAAACAVYGGQEYLLLTYGYDTDLVTEALITACPITTSVAPISGTPTIIHLATGAEVFYNGEGITYPTTRLAVTSTGQIIGTIPNILRRVDRTQVFGFAATFDGSTFEIQHDTLLRTSTRYGAPYSGPVTVAPGTEEAISFYITEQGSIPDYLVQQFNASGIVATGGWGDGVHVSHLAGYYDVEWSFLGETGWSVVATNTYIDQPFGQTLWLVNTHLIPVPPTVRTPRSISARPGGPRVVFE